MTVIAKPWKRMCKDSQASAPGSDEDERCLDRLRSFNHLRMNHN